MSLVRSLAAASMRGALGAAALVSALALSACGGNVSRSEPYVPERLVAFGDEHSVIESNGHKYTINAVDSTNTTTFVCSSNPIWPQYVAQGYGFYFAQCNPNNVTPKAVSYAAFGATVDDVITQVANNGAGFTSTTLVTLMAGMHDVLNAYARVDANTLSADDAKALMTTQGTKLGQLVNQIAAQGAGARVLFALVPDISYSPYAIAEDVAHVGAGRQQLLRDMVNNLNKAARLAVIDNGRWSALITANEIVSGDAKVPASYGFTDVVTAGCTTASVLDCTTSTVQTSGTIYLWADNLHVAYTAHNQIGSNALYKAQNNPF